MPRPHHTLAVLASVLAIVHAAPCCADDETGVQGPEGFAVQVYADDELAHDIYCMTLDSHGRVVVSGAGYTRILFDEDGDGRADSYKTFVDGPLTGAQGMYFDGSDLISVGDAGVLRYRDRDGDDRADGPPEVLLRIRTGGEHYAHAIRRGPDGYWYLLAGNDALVTKDYITDPHSPVKDPRAGVLLRISPDFSSCSVVMDGMRNAYDFDFHPSGAAFVYDSDDERDVTLPWYRPTRVFQVVPGAHAGWISRSWKHPEYFADMPPVVAQLGRGSPTGVVCYRHHAFPEIYRSSLFVADWTFGRVYLIPLIQDELTTAWMGEPQVFLRNVGTHGFAPTDLEVAPDGSLFVSVGGRGTRGGVLRVTWGGTAETDLSQDWLNVPQPLSAWSRSRWEPIARQYNPSGLMSAIMDEQLDVAARARALELLTWLSRSAEYQEWQQQLLTWPNELRARVAWSFGRFTQLHESNAAMLQLLLEDDDARVSAAALETLLMTGGLAAHPDYQTSVLRLLQHDSPVVRQLAARVCREFAIEDRARWLALISTLPAKAQLAGCLSLVERSRSMDLAAYDISQNVFLTSADEPTKLEALRIMQLALGDVGPQSDRDAVFDGYAPRVLLSSLEDQLIDRVIALAAQYPTGQQRIDFELERWFAMVAADMPELLDRVLANISADSSPTRDIHSLIVVARMDGAFSDQQCDRTAAAFASLEYKVQQGALHQDRNWAPRLRELFTALTEKDAKFAESFVSSSQFGHPAHAMFLDLITSELKQRAIDQMLAKYGITEAAGTAELLTALGQSPHESHRIALRKFVQLPVTANWALTALAQQPQLADEDFYYQGVQSKSFETVVSCLAALERLPAAKSGQQFAALVAAFSHLEGDEPSYQARERIARLLERVVPEAFGFTFGPDGYRPQNTVVQRWQQWLQVRFPDAAPLITEDSQDVNWLDDQLELVDWSKGDAMRGSDLFQRKSCHQCHGGRSALGPDLAGVTGRFSLRDLFTAIAFPSLHVSPRYQTTVVETNDGHIYQGAVVYESVDGVTLTTSANRTVRIDASEIAQRMTSPLSLMPNGLLDGCGPQDYADLKSYLDSIGEGESGK